MKTFSKLAGIALIIALFVVTATLVLYPQPVIDWWRLRAYVPSAEISQLADDASFTDEGRRLFYVYYPELLDKPNFQGKCSSIEEIIVLGCYLSQEKIFVFDVEDERLEGVEQVTAAHEMLHVVYERLSDTERNSIDKLLISHFETLNDERLNKTIESYRARDASVVSNELHSILGTEFRDLPKELEDHYNKYFLDRLSVVTLAEAYEAEFTSREKEIESYDSRLKALSVSIDDQETQLEFLGSSLMQEKSQLERLRGNTDAYNDAVPVFNQKVRDYNNLLENLKSDITDYNNLIVERNKIAIQEQELVEAIDSRKFETE